jgi:hypothetical protein
MIEFLKNEPRKNAEQTMKHINQFHNCLQVMFIGVPLETKFSMKQKQLEKEDFVGIYKIRCECDECKKQ